MKKYVLYVRLLAGNTNGVDAYADMKIETDIDVYNNTYLKSMEVASINDRDFENITGKMGRGKFIKLEKILPFPIVAIYKPILKHVSAPPPPRQPYFSQLEIYVRSFREKNSEWDLGKTDYKIGFDYNPVANEYHVTSIGQITIDDATFRDVTEKFNKGTVEEQSFLSKVRKSLDFYCIRQGIKPINIDAMFMKVNKDEDDSNKRTVHDVHSITPEPFLKRQKLSYYDGRYHKRGLRKRSPRK